MAIRIQEVRVKSILTRTSGYLADVTSHSLQPYRGCSYGRSLCGVGCYVQHNTLLTRGRAWGSFLDVRVDAAEVYIAQVVRERRWARRSRGGFRIFFSSSTDPFVPQERRYGVSGRVLAAMRHDPPDTLIVQTHSARVLDALDVLVELARVCELRVQVSLESDRETLPGLPPPASSVDARFEALAALRSAGIFCVATVSPLLPIAAPDAFFRRIAAAADAVVIDHFIGGDGSADGARTRRTALPGAMAAVAPGSLCFGYRDRMLAVAREWMPGRVGVGPEGFAGRYA